MSNSKMETELEPLNQSCPVSEDTATNKFVDGSMPQVEYAPVNANNPPSRGTGLSKTAWVIAILLLLCLLLLLLLATGLAVYLGVAYQKCKNVENVTNTEQNETQPSTCVEFLRGKELDVLYHAPSMYENNSQAFNSSALNVSSFKQYHKSVRLSNSVIPKYYTLALQAHIHEGPDTYFNGSVRIELFCLTATDNFAVHAVELSGISEETVQVVMKSAKMKQQNLISNITYDSYRQWFRINLREPMQEGLYYEVIFSTFHANLTQQLKGWYLSTYEENGVLKRLATSQLQPTDARRVFPCLDEPSYKAQFQVTLIRHKDFHSLSNTERTSTHEIDDIWRADVFAPTVNMSTYLLAFVVSQFESLEAKDSKGRSFKVWSRPEKTYAAKYSLDLGIKILKFFEDYFELPYMLKKLDMVAVPDFYAGAMENWGLLIYREQTMLWDPQLSTAEDLRKVAMIIAHEIAHQWFGNVVTLAWWDDLWLNEGFASFVEYIGVDHVYPTWRMDEQYKSLDIQQVLSSDSTRKSHPVFQPVYHPDEINKIFDTISYNKGSSLIRMLQAILGKELFRIGLKNYLSKHKFQNTVHDDLWRALTETAATEGKDIDVKMIMDSWIKQVNYPLVTIKRLQGKRFLFKQQPYLERISPALSKEPSTYEFSWHIPLSYACANNPNWDNMEFIWMQNETMEMELDIEPGSWYVFNLRQIGFYRVHYMDDNWNLLAEQLRKNHSVFPVHARAQLFSDLFDLANNGWVNYGVFFNFTRYLKKETEYVMWETARQAFSSLFQILAFDSIVGTFQKYVLSLVDEQFHLVNWESIPENVEDLSAFMRSAVITLACNAEHIDCIDKARFYYKKLMDKDNSTKIPPSLKQTIFCTAVKYGGPKEYNYLEKYLEHLDPKQDAALFDTIYCSRDITHLTRESMPLLNMEVSFKHCMADTVDKLLCHPMGNVLLWKALSSAWPDAICRENTTETRRFGGSNYNIQAFGIALRLISRKSVMSYKIPSIDEVLTMIAICSPCSKSWITPQLNELVMRTTLQAEWTAANRPVIQEWLQKYSKL